MKWKVAFAAGAILLGAQLFMSELVDSSHTVPNDMLYRTVTGATIILGGTLLWRFAKRNG